MSKPSSPAPPDYVGAAQQQGQANIQGSIANQILANRNQITPFGNLTFSQTGMDNTGGTAATPGQPAGGEGLWRNMLIGGNPGTPGTNVPTFTSTATLSPALQDIFDQYTRNQRGMAGVAGNLLDQANSTLSTPFDPSKLPASSTQDAVTNALYQRQQQYLDPQWAQSETAQRDALANQGFQVGNEGFDKAMTNFGLAKQKAYADARDSAIATGQTAGLATRQQAVAEALQARNQPINELSALQTGSQITPPTFASGAAQPIGGAPYMSAAEAQNQARLQQYGINSGIYNSQMGGLAGLGGAAMLAFA